MNEFLDAFIQNFDTQPSETTVEIALRRLSTHLSQRNLIAVFQRLSERPLLLEFVLSNLPASVPIRTWISNAFAKDAEGFKSSFATSLLMKLSSFFLIHHDLPFPQNSSLSDQLSKIDRLVSRGPYALEVLTQLTFGKHSRSNTSEFFVPSKLSKSQRKAHKRMSSLQENNPPKRAMDPALLSDFGLDVPHSALERDRAISEILSFMENWLDFYLQLLHFPRIPLAVKTLFISQLPANDFPNEDSAAVLEGQQEEEAHSIIQPLKSARHFSNVEGFGDWRILISTRADGDLREASRKNRKMFKIFVKKIKELSNGHFSPDNHKRLTGPNIQIPIYEAKMTGDTRLVYQVDCVAAYDSEAEMQVVRIFGIYTHAQMDDRLWHSVGSQLAKKGKEYRKRCIYRQRVNDGGNDIYAPATFPHPPEVEQVTQYTPDLPPDDLEQIHSLLVLEKYLDFSHELLQSILANLDVSFPFQVSPQEKEIIEHPDSCYVLGRSGTGKTTTMLFKMLWVEKAYELNKDGMPRPRQIFVTKSRVLARKVEESFTKLLASLRIEAKPLQEIQTYLRRDIAANTNEDLVDVDDEVNWRTDLPKRFGELQDKHFPLFLTFDHLCDMIEGDGDIVYSPIAVALEATGVSSPFVTFDQFRYQYWPHFPQSLTKGLDPALVFSEIIGIIKGSEETLSTDERFLSRRTYEDLSERSYSTFASQRSVVYSIFEAYQAQKRQRSERDAADRTHSLLKLIESSGVKGKKIDQLYVDEAQDNLLIDALVLRSLSHNVNGLFWAGDTAQTISVGSSFRFDDLKAFLFRIEKQQAQNQKNRRHFGRDIKPPKAFQLVTNYRSHGGIVNSAHSIIELITRFWPYSIDNLEPEKGIVDGPKPLFLIGWDDDNIRYEQFLFGASGSHLEFGAQQCILVRDEAARTKLEEQVGNIGLIMTLYESKGLEFNDVLLFNFFEDSACDLSQWRVILNEIEPGLDTNGLLAPRFDPVRHAPICFELKFLYVALTRARKNLWIADKSLKSDPIRMYWSSRGQIQTCSPGDKIPQLAVASGIEEWASKGRELFSRKRYLQAKYCYERAKQPREVAISEAYLLREEARKIPVTTDSRVTLQKRYQAFFRAATAFCVCAQDATKNKLIYLLRAAECFEQAGDELRAARAYQDAERYDNAAKLFRKIGRFDDAVAIIKRNSARMNQDLVETIKDVARLYYFREEQLVKARDLFTSDDEALEYLKDLDLDLAQADVLVSLGRFSEAAQLHASEGRMLSAIPLFLKDAENIDSSRQAGSTLLRELWRSISFGQPIPVEMSTTRLAQWLENIRLEDQEEDHGRELLMFKALLQPKRQLNQLLGLANDFILSGSSAAALLCLDRHFSTFPSPKLLTNEELAKTLSMFLSYIRLLYDIAFRPHLYDGAVVAKLFGCIPSTGDTFLVPPSTFLYHFGTRSTSLVGEQNDANLSLSKSELYQTLRLALCQRLRERISDQVEACKRGAQFTSCLNFAISGVCNRVGCPSEHTSIASVTQQWYTTRVRLHLLQVLIHQVLHSTGSDGDMKRQKRHLLNQFYESLFPSYYCLGTPEHLLPSSIPEWSRGIHVVRDWVEDLAYTLDLRGGPYTLTHLVRGARLAFYFDQQKAPSYWLRSLCVTQMVPLFVRPPGLSLVGDILLSTESTQVQSISAGIIAVRHIVAARLPIQSATLCDFVESLCAAITTSSRLKAGRGLHGLTLPRSWASRTIANPMLGGMHLNTGLQYQLVDHVGQLLEMIYTGEGADFLLFESGSLASIPSANIRAVFIVRLIRAVCVLGYNINNFGLRNNVTRAITSLKRVDRRFPSVYRTFVESRHWEYLVRALRNLTDGALSDGLIQLHDLGQGPLPRPLPGVTTVGFRNRDDLHLQLSRYSLPSALTTPPALDATNGQLPIDTDPVTMLVQAAEQPESAQYLPDMQDDSEASGTTEDDAMSLPDTGDTEPVVFDDGDIETVPGNASQEHTPTDEEIHAAIVIQRKYRMSTRQRAQRDLKGLPAARQALFAKCLERAQTMEWAASTYYRSMFLGPLPHILLCLEVTLAALNTQKVKAKKRLLAADHQELDTIMQQLTQLQNSHKTLIRLQRTLDPRSDAHNSKNNAALKRQVQETNTELRSLPISLPHEVVDDLELGYRSIVMERKQKEPATTKPKPSLNLEDDLSYDYL